MTTSSVAQAFTEFAKDFEPRLRLALVAAFGVEAGVEATSEALAYAWEHWDSLSSRPNPAGYLFGVGRNKARKRRKTRTLLPAPPVNHEFFVEPGLPDALNRLSDRQRVAVLLVHGEDWTHSEVADLLGLSVSTVQQHAERGISKRRKGIGADR